MTEKRFTYLDASRNKYIGSFFCNGIPLTNPEVADLMNGLTAKNKVLHKEIERLKTQNKDLLYSNAKNMELLEEENKHLKLDFKDKVFNLINAKIKLYSHKPVSAPISQPMSVNFDADVDRLARLSELEALKKELTE